MPVGAGLTAPPVTQALRASGVKPPPTANHLMFAVGLLEITLHGECYFTLNTA